jgi:chromate reductase, NAD(P)H dehydrogenase (quinone)
MIHSSGHPGGRLESIIDRFQYTPVSSMPERDATALTNETETLDRHTRRNDIMPEKPNVLAFAGSLRSGSYNKKLIKLAAKSAERAGADVTLLDLRELDLPIYDGDLEDKHGLPEGAKKLKQLMKSHDGFLIASPEYNSSVSAALKNAIDWASRPADDDYPLQAFAGKIAGIMAASPGALGGLRGLFQLRFILSNIQVLVIPDQHAIVKANEAFDENGSLTDENHAKKIDAIAGKVVDLIKRMK